jgi:hypothetical protein
MVSPHYFIIFRWCPHTIPKFCMYGVHKLSPIYSFLTPFPPAHIVPTDCFSVVHLLCSGL